jgi:drug/metabolite transporter (DMT)-like permease
MTTHKPLRAALFLIAALLLFACMDATTKYLSEQYEAPLVVAVRYLVNLALLTLVFVPRDGLEFAATERTGLVWVRAGCLTLASLFVAFALQRMPVAEVTAINFLAPILVVVVAGPLLKERVGALGWTAVLLGFAGVLIIVRPGGGTEWVAVLSAFGAVLANAAYQLLSRILADTERTAAMLFYTGLAGAIILGPTIPWFWGGPQPTALQLGLFFSLGVYGGLGHFLFTAAYRRAPASLLSPLLYLQLVWAGLLGWLIFGHLPDAPTLVGMAIVVASGVLIAWRSKDRSTSVPRPSATRTTCG